MQSRQVLSLATVLGLIAAAFWLLGDRPAAQVSVTTSDRQLGDIFSNAGARLVDLTHAFDEQTVPWPTEVGFRLERGFDGVTDGGWYYRANRFSMAEHSGTRVDAPNHFSRSGKPADEIPLERLMGAGALVDVSDECRDNSDFLVTIEHFKAWERRTGRSLKNAIVLVRTGWEKFWPDRERYLGTTETGREGVAKLHFPGVAPEAAAWLATERKIRAIGIDTASIDYGQTKTFGAHVALCAHQIPAFENLTELDRLPITGFTVIALPMKIRGGSGGPLRAIAVIPETVKKQ